MNIMLVCMQNDGKGMIYQAVDYMPGVGVMSRVTPLASNPVHDLVFALARDASVGDNDLYL